MYSALQTVVLAVSCLLFLILFVVLRDVKAVVPADGGCLQYDAKKIISWRMLPGGGLQGLWKPVLVAVGYERGSERGHSPRGSCHYK